MESFQFYGNFSACFCEILHPSHSYNLTLLLFFSHNIWLMSECWRSCPSMPKWALPGYFTANSFPKKQSGVSTPRDFRKWKIIPWNMQGSVCVSLYVQGKAFPLSGLLSFEPQEANLLWSIFKALWKKVFLKVLQWKYFKQLCLLMTCTVCIDIYICA